MPFAFAGRRHLVIITDRNYKRNYVNQACTSAAAVLAAKAGVPVPPPAVPVPTVPIVPPAA